MTFVNPIEILDLQDSNSSNIDNATIKKAKRRLFADIDLSDDGHLDYNGNSLTKADCEKAINELENQTIAEFYIHLANNKLLNKYLTKNDESIFASFKQEGIYKMPEFVKFISSHFASRFNKSLYRAFIQNDVEKVKSILRTQMLIDNADINTAFKSVSAELQSRIQQINQLKEKLQNEDMLENDEVIELVEKLFPISVLNALPSYFQSQINKIASAINFLQLEIWNLYYITDVPLRLLEHLLKLNIESVGKPVFEKNYSIIKRKHDEEIEKRKNAPILKKWADTFTQLRSTSEQIEQKKINPKQAEIILAKVDIQELNSLASFANEIRTSISMVIRSISISMWNQHGDINGSINTLNKALAISLTNQDAKAKLLQDSNKLNEIKKERERLGEPIKSAPDLGTFYGIGTTIYGDTHYFVVLGIPVFPIARYNCQELFAGHYRFYGKLKLHKWQKIWQIALPVAILIWILIGTLTSNSSSSNYDDYSSSNYSSPSSTTTTTAPPQDYGRNDYSSSYNSSNSTTPLNLTTESKYRGNKLKDGASPFDGCFGKGKYAGQAWIKFDNSNANDAVVCLVNVYSGKTIRNEYIRAGSSYKMSNIPTGTYYIKVYYGNDWNPTKTNFCGTSGAFDSDEHFSKSDNPSDYIEISNNEYSFSTWTITLYTVPGGNMSTESTTESDFFKN